MNGGGTDARSYDHVADQIDETVQVSASCHRAAGATISIARFRALGFRLTGACAPEMTNGRLDSSGEFYTILSHSLAHSPWTRI
jgi:hypothetical protein